MAHRGALLALALLNSASDSPVGLAGSGLFRGYLKPQALAPKFTALPEPQHFLDKMNSLAPCMRLETISPTFQVQVVFSGV